jgi:hypothetical protein
MQSIVTDLCFCLFYASCWALIVIVLALLITILAFCVKSNGFLLRALHTTRNSTFPLSLLNSCWKTLVTDLASLFAVSSFTSSNFFSSVDFFSGHLDLSQTRLNYLLFINNLTSLILHYSVTVSQYTYSQF